MTPTATDPCPCGGYDETLTYAACCRSFVVDGQPAPTCEQLMRSRYTAFAVGDADHVWRTWHPRTRPPQLADLNSGTWLGLEVLDVVGGGVDDSSGVVEFRALHGGGDGQRAVMHERSRFERRAGRWFYVDGDELP